MESMPGNDGGFFVIHIKVAQTKYAGEIRCLIIHILSFQWISGEQMTVIHVYKDTSVYVLTVSLAY